MIFDRIRAAFDSNDEIGARLGRFRAWLSTLPREDARAMALRTLALSQRFRITPGTGEARASTVTSLPSDARALFEMFARIEGGGAVLDAAAISRTADQLQSFVVGSDIEHADIMLRADGTAFIADTDVSAAGVQPFNYLSLWHYLLEVDAFTWPHDSEAARAAAA
jgi:hypothetical protein